VRTKRLQGVASQQQGIPIPLGSTDSRGRGRHERRAWLPHAEKGENLPGACGPRAGMWAAVEDAATIGGSGGRRGTH
jgi:hypothetical protein